MTLLGVGTTASDFNDGGGNTSLGRIGVGYMYADWKGQIQYTSPGLERLSSSVVAVDDPWGVVNLVRATASNACLSSSSSRRATPTALEGKAAYTWKGSSLERQGLGELHLSVARF
mgnify:CR=1 FL=1